jgi:hypothetical protein
MMKNPSAPSFNKNRSSNILNEVNQNIIKSNMKQDSKFEGNRSSQKQQLTQSKLKDK